MNDEGTGFRRRLKDAIAYRDMTTQELADRSGVKKRTIRSASPGELQRYREK